MPPLSLQQLETRHLSLGGSEAAAACGVCPYTTPLQLYMEKTGLTQREDIGNQPPVYWGNRLEDIVADEYTVRTGNVTQEMPMTLYHHEHAFLSANLDRIIPALKRILECKTAGPFSKDDWGEPETDEIPMNYIVQVQHYLSVTGYDIADLAVLIGGQDYRIYQIHRDDDLIADLTNALKVFWARVQEQNPPDPSNHDDLKLLYGVDKGSAIVTTQEVTDAYQSLKALKQTIKDNDKQKLELEFTIKNFMANNTTLLNANDKPMATWKTQKNNRFQIDDFRGEHPDLAAAFTLNNPSRVLRLKKGA